MLLISISFALGFAQGIPTGEVDAQKSMYCEDSPVGPMCFMQCGHDYCPEGQCRMRKGWCCDSYCVKDKSQDDGICPGDTVFNTCGTACPLICGKPEPKLCTLQCVAECQCPSGLFRTKDNRCVAKEECGVDPAVCKNGYEWDDLLQKCVAVTCDAKPCESGQVCKKASNVCVRAPCPQFQCVADVAPICPGSTVFNGCGTACPLICGKPEPKFCTLQCVPECQCPNGLFRTKDDRCVAKGECEVPACKNGFEWDDLLQKCVAVSCDANPCKSGQECKKATNVCIRAPCPQFQCVEKSKPKCPGSTVFNKCGTACPLKCGEERPQFCTRQCVAECQCPNGLWRTADDDCVTEESCSSSDDTPKCPGKTVFNQCGSSCPLVCGRKEPQICNLMCNAECQCPTGLYRTADDDCVPKEECSEEESSVCKTGEEWDRLRRECVPVSCDAMPCGDGKICVPDQLMCYRSPCPQFKCLAPCNDDEEFDIFKGECVPKKDHTWESYKEACKDMATEDDCLNFGCFKFKKGKCLAPKFAKKIKCTNVDDEDLCKALKCKYKKGCKGKSKLQ